MTQKKKKTCNMNTKNRYVIILQALRKEKQVQHFPERKFHLSQIVVKTKSLNKDCLKQSFEIICPTFTTRFKFNNYFSIFLDLLQITFLYWSLPIVTDLQIFFLSSINESHLYLLPAIMINIKQESMSQKISFKQPNKYSQNSPECRILTRISKLFEGAIYCLQLQEYCGYN